jgi:hypothetical protein
MGMDVYGKAPAEEVGEYFRRSVWGWHPLWTYVEDLHADLAVKVQYGHTNDGDGLEAGDAAELARRLRHDVETGRVAAYVGQRNAELAALPDEKCNLCDETGARTDEVGRQYGYDKPNGCNGCKNSPAPPGYKRPFATWYRLEIEDVAEFAEFLQASGGFEIY